MTFLWKKRKSSHLNRLECYLYDAHRRYHAIDCLLFRNLRGLNRTTLVCCSIPIIITLTFRKKKKNTFGIIFLAALNCYFSLEVVYDNLSFTYFCFSLSSLMLPPDSIFLSSKTLLFFLIFLKDNRFIECCFLSNLNMNQP